MRLLFIGGTGNISAACVRLALAQGHQVTLLHRGTRDLAAHGLPPDLPCIHADLKDESAVASALSGRTFDAVANFIAFTASDVERDIRLFSGRTAHYLFISSASAYEKPLTHPFITESHPLKNPYWQYSRDKIAAEEACIRAWRESDFPATIVRPSLTYDTVWPVAIGGWNDFTLVDRIRRGGEIVVHGDGRTLWTVTHADDFARGFNGLLGLPAARGHAFHITSDEVLTWNQIYSTLAEAAGVAPNLVHIPVDFLAKLSDWERSNLLGDKAHSAVFDNSKIKRFVPGFQAIIPWHVGVRRTLAWFEADPARQIIKPEINQTLDHYLAAWRAVSK
jgi:nucleoside-diphosphate-sugar epimerase